MLASEKQESFLSLIKERNQRQEDDREVTFLDMLRKRRKLLEIRQTRANLIKVGNERQEKDK